MRKVAPSVMAREELDRLLAGGVEEGANLISEVVATCTRLVVQSLLEAEQRDFCGWPGPLSAPGRGCGASGIP